MAATHRRDAKRARRSKTHASPSSSFLIEPLENRLLLTVYYVSNSGNDSNNGTSQATPWATVAKVDATVFLPGDQILFQRGGNWHESLIASASGTAGSPITYSDFGATSQPLPTFWGSDVVANSAFTSIGNGVYTFSTSAVPTGQVYYVFANHQFLSAATSSSGMPSDSFFINGSTVYVNTGGNNPTSGAVVYTATDRGTGTNANDGVIASNGFSNLIFENLIGEESAEDAPGGNISGGIPDAYVIRVQGGSNVQLINDTAINGGKHNIGAIDTTGFIGTGLLAEGCMPGLPFGNATALVSYSDFNQSGDTYQWINCTVENYSGSQPAFLTHADDPGNITSILLQNLTCIGSQIALETQTGEQITIKGGLIQNNDIDDYGSGVLIDGLTMTGSGAKITLYGSNNTVQNTLIENSGQDGGIISMGSNNLIRFNTIDMSPGAAAIHLTSAATTNIIYGNLITGTTNSFEDDGANPVSMNYDFFDSTPGAPNFRSNGSTLTLAQWQTAGHEAGAIVGVPLFTNAAGGDFSLQTGSPAIDGVPTAGITGITTDILGNPRPVGSAYDMGAYENQAAANGPKISSAAAANPSPVVGKTTALSVLATDPAGEPSLTYTWATTGNVPAPVVFSSNGSNASKNTTATFTLAGVYNFVVTVTDPSNLKATSSVSVTVNQTLTTITVTPSTAAVADGSTKAFSASALDQFGAAMATQPAFAWSVDSGGAGSVNPSTGVYSAPLSGTGSATVRAASGGISGTASVTNTTPPTVSQAASATPNPVTAKSTALSVLGADAAGESSLTYTWATTGSVPAPVVFSANGANASKNTTATFTKAGIYNFQVAITDPSKLSTTSSISVTVNQTVTTITVTPTPVTVTDNFTQQFSATAFDQFGAALITQPSFVWTVDGGGVGSVSSTGIYSAPPSGTGSATVRAANSGVSGTASVTTTTQPPMLFWDPGQSDSGNGSGGSGAWNSSNTDWYSANSNADVAWVPGATAVFSATAGTVTVASSINTSGMIFNTDGYSVTGNTLTFINGNTIDVNVGTATVGSVLAGSVGMSKTGPGTLVLTGAETYTGATTINNGILSFDSTGTDLNSSSFTANPGTTFIVQNTSGAMSDRIGSSAAITLNGGALEYFTVGSGNSSESIGGANLGTGLSYYVADPSPNKVLSFTLSSLTAAAGATLNIGDSSLGIGGFPSANVAITNTPANLIGGGATSGNDESILPFIAWDNANTVNGTYFGWVTYQNGGLSPLVDGTNQVFNYNQNINSGTTSQDNVNLNNSQAVTAATTINSLILNSAGGDVSGAGAITLSSGALMYQRNASMANAIIFPSGIAGYLYVSGSSTAPTIHSAFSGNTGLTITGENTTSLITLAGISTYTGTTYINNALVANSAPSNFGNSALIVLNDNAFLAPTANNFLSSAQSLTFNDGSSLSAAGLSSTVNNVTFNPGNSGISFDYNTQLKASGAVNLNGATLDLVLPSAPVAGTKYTLISNLGGLAVNGTFAGLAQGATVQAKFGGTTYSFQISYTGGSGHDVTLTAASNGLQAATTTTLANNGSNVSLTTQSMSFTATVTGGVPNGESVKLEDASNGNAVVATGTLTGGSVTFSLPAGTLALGSHNLFAVYGGDANFIGSQSSTITQTIVAQPTVSSVVVNGNNTALAGAQRSMVDSIVYTFSQAVKITGPGALTLSVHAGQTGTLPTLALTALNPNPDGSSTQWAVSFTGNGVVGNSIANGVYDITLNAGDVTLDGFPTVTAQSRPTDTFYRLFGDFTGAGRVNTADYLDFLSTFSLKSTSAGFLAAFDFNGDGRVNTSDYLDFLNDFGLRYSGFTATI